MSSNTTTSNTNTKSSAKSSAKASSNTPTNTNTNTNTDTTTDSAANSGTMHDFTSQFDKSHVFASQALKVLSHLAESKLVLGFDMEKAWALFDTLTVEERKDSNALKARKVRKNAVVTSANFVPEGTKKPRGVRDLFRTQFRLAQAEQKKPYTDAEFREAWESISDKELEDLKQQRDEQLRKYEEDRVSQLQDKIDSGEIDEKPPKALPNAFFMFKEQVTSNPSNFLSKSEVTKFGAMKSTEQAKFLGEKYKTMKETNDKVYQAIHAELESLLPRHVAEKYEWKLRCARRKLARAERLDEDVDKWKTTVLNLENEAPEGYTPTAAATSEASAPSKGKGKKGGKKDKAAK